MLRSRLVRVVIYLDLSIDLAQRDRMRGDADARRESREFRERHRVRLKSMDNRRRCEFTDEFGILPRVGADIENDRRRIAFEEAGQKTPFTTDGMIFIVQHANGMQSPIKGSTPVLDGSRCPNQQGGQSLLDIDVPPVHLRVTSMHLRIARAILLLLACERQPYLID